MAAEVHGGGVVGACVRAPRVRPGNSVRPWAGTRGGEDADFAAAAEALDQAASEES